MRRRLRGATAASIARVRTGLALDQFTGFMPMSVIAWRSSFAPRDAELVDRTLDSLLRAAQAQGSAGANLVDNALKYTPAGGSIELRVGRSGEKVQLVVADTGPGVPMADRELVLRRFVRLADSSAAPGTGLGLSLVSAVTRLHRATLSLLDNDPGLKVVIEFPAEP